MNVKYLAVMKKCNELKDGVILIVMFIDEGVAQLMQISAEGLVNKRLPAAGSIPHWNCFVALLAKNIFLLSAFCWCRRQNDAFYKIYLYI